MNKIKTKLCQNLEQRTAHVSHILATTQREWSPVMSSNKVKVTLYNTST